MKELGEYLKRTRISNGVSLTEACEDLDFSTSHLENIESGNVRAFKDVYELKESIKTHCKNQIADYAVPKEIEFRKELPKTLVGKVAYKELEEK